MIEAFTSLEKAANGMNLFINQEKSIQGVTGGMRQTSGGCSLC